MKWLGAGNVPVSSTNNTVLNNSGSHLVSNLHKYVAHLLELFVLQISFN